MYTSFPGVSEESLKNDVKNPEWVGRVNYILIIIILAKPISRHYSLTAGFQVRIRPFK